MKKIFSITVLFLIGSEQVYASNAKELERSECTEMLENGLIPLVLTNVHEDLRKFREKLSKNVTFKTLSPEDQEVHDELFNDVTFKIFFSPTSSKRSLELNQNLEKNLEKAFKHGFMDIVDILIKNGVTFQFDLLSYYGTACIQGDKDLVQLLIKNGADVNAQDEKGRTPLHLACFKWYKEKEKDFKNKQCVETIQVLIKNGANVNAKNKKGATPLHSAFQEGEENCKDRAEILIKSGANVNAKDDNGETPLFLAKGNDLVKYLVNEGADVNIINKNKQSVLRKFIDEGNKEILEFLIERGANPALDEKLLLSLIRDLSLFKTLMSKGADLNWKHADKAFLKLLVYYSEAAFTHVEEILLLMKHVKNFNVRATNQQYYLTPLDLLVHNPYTRKSYPHFSQIFSLKTNEKEEIQKRLILELVKRGGLFSITGFFGSCSKEDFKNLLYASVFGGKTDSYLLDEFFELARDNKKLKYDKKKFKNFIVKNNKQVSNPKNLMTYKHKDSKSINWHKATFRELFTAPVLSYLWPNDIKNDLNLLKEYKAKNSPTTLKLMKNGFPGSGISCWGAYLFLLHLKKFSAMAGCKKHLPYDFKIFFQKPTLTESSVNIEELIEQIEEKSSVDLEKI